MAVMAKEAGIPGFPQLDWRTPAEYHWSSRSVFPRQGVHMKLLVTLEKDETGIVIAECPSIPGCISQGKTEDEALANIREAIEGCLKTREANGMPLTVVIREVEVTV